MKGIFFPGIGIYFGNVPSSFSIFGFKITLYAIAITLGYILAYTMSVWMAKRSGQEEEDYLDYLLVMVIPTIIGARLYYVIFNYKHYFVEGRGAWDTFVSIINIRIGGLAVYGGLIVGVLVAYFYTKKRKLWLPLFGDTICMGVLIGQILGRWGNFFNREAFGGYTNSFFRMAIPLQYFEENFSMKYLTSNNILTDEMLNNLETVRDMSCVTVHPAFLYEGLWNLALLIFLFIYKKHKKFDGEMGLMYLAGYGFGRFFVEALRSDSLMIGPLKISQIVAILCVVGSIGLIVYNRINIKKGKEPKLHLVK